MALMALPASATAKIGRDATFPTMFISAWGPESCSTEADHHVVIGPHALQIDHRDAQLLSIRAIHENVVDVRYRLNRQLRTERMTVGTTGSRLFRERGGNLINVHYRCVA